MTGSPLRVGLNLLWMGEQAGGAGRAARGLVRGLLEAEPATAIHLFVARDAPADLESEPWWGSVRTSTLPVPAGGSPATLLAQHGALPAIAAARRLDVLHSPANAGPPMASRCATVVTLLDLIWWHRPHEWEGDARAHRAIRRQALYAVRRADLVFAISHAAAADIRSTLGLDPRRVHVAPLGVDTGGLIEPTSEADLRARLGLGEARIVLCVAQKRAYKNLASLIRAIAQLDAALVLPGAPTEHEEELRSLARSEGVAERVHFVNWLGERDLEGLYGLAACFVLPSFIEGFGLPVLEAMRRGLPVACSNVASLPEVAGDAALLFDPHDQGEVTAAIRRLLADAELRARLIQRGHARCSELTWRHTGAAALEGYWRAIATRS